MLGLHITMGGFPMKAWLTLGQTLALVSDRLRSVVHHLCLRSYCFWTIFVRVLLLRTPHISGNSPEDCAPLSPRSTRSGFEKRPARPLLTPRML